MNNRGGVAINRDDINFSIKDVYSKKKIREFGKQNSILSQLKRKGSIDEYDCDPKIAEKNHLTASIIILKKVNKTIDDNIVLVSFLKTLLPFVKMIQDASVDNDYEELMRKISFVLKYNFLPENKIHFRYGDKGDKFYIILKGKVAILIPKDERIRMSKLDYVSYLLKLRKYNELELLQKCLIINKLIFKVDDDDFDMWIVKAYDKIRQKQNDTNKFNIKVNPLKSLLGSKCVKKILKIEEDLDSAEIKEYNYIITNLKDEIKETYEALKNNINHINLTEIVTVSQYINRIFPTKRKLENNELYPNDSNNDNESLINVKVWLYNHILTLSDGDKFGDYALESTYNYKRTATVISVANAHFGVMDKKSYGNIVKNINEKVKKMNLNFILSQTLFKNCNAHLFMKNYFHFFVIRKINFRDHLIFEGGDPENLFIIKEGEFEITTHKSISEINDIIKILKCGDESHISKIEIDQYLGGDCKFKKFLNEKKFFKISIVQSPDIQGLEDCIHNNKYLYSVRCISHKSEVYEIKTKIFKQLCESDEAIKINLKDFLSKKCTSLLIRLMGIKQTRLKFFQSFYNSDQNNLREIKTKLNLNKKLIIENNEYVGKKLNLSRSDRVFNINSQNTTESSLEKSSNVLIKKGLTGKYSHCNTDNSDIVPVSDYYTISNKNSKIPNVKKLIKLQKDLNNDYELSIKESETSNKRYEFSQEFKANLKKSFNYIDPNLPGNIFNHKNLNLMSNVCEVSEFHTKTEYKLDDAKIDSSRSNKKMNIYKEIAKISKKSIEYQNVISKHLFEKVFLNYIQDDKINTSLEISEIEKQKEKTLINCKFNKKKKLKKNKNVNNNEIKDENFKDANVVDCLVMDNFNRIYNTICHYSNITGRNRNKHSNDISIEKIQKSNIYDANNKYPFISLDKESFFTKNTMNNMCLLENKLIKSMYIKHFKK